MPKMKTRKIVSKRFKITSTGKVMHGVQGARHLRRNKTKSRQRRQDKMMELKTNRHSRNIRTMLQK
ncbi:TPA: 50S ribosomal protein L35 [Patescibacteria group bacterium]|nr:50S ribosomal protein L35 [Patescibacteria group bacterium]